MVFVADDLAAWLIGLLADAGRKKLTRLVLGSDQERVLRQAATAAIESTAAELGPSGNDQAMQLAMVVSESSAIRRQTRLWSGERRYWKRCRRQ